MHTHLNSSHSLTCYFSFALHHPHYPPKSSLSMYTSVYDSYSLGEIYLYYHILFVDVYCHDLWYASISLDAGVYPLHRLYPYLWITWFTIHIYTRYPGRGSWKHRMSNYTCSWVSSLSLYSPGMAKMNDRVYGGIVSSRITSFSFLHTSYIYSFFLFMFFFQGYL